MVSFAALLSQPLRLRCGDQSYLLVIHIDSNRTGRQVASVNHRFD